MKQQMIKHMRQTIDDNNLVGLSSNQLGYEPTHCIVLGKVYRYPEIVWKSSAETDIEVEGCYSLPNEVYMVRRYKRIVVSYRNGKHRKFKQLDGFAARVMQHEIDHLTNVSKEKPYGITIKDRKI